MTTASVELITLPVGYKEREKLYKKKKCSGPMKVLNLENFVSKVGLELTIFCLQGRALIHYTST